MIKIYEGQMTQLAELRQAAFAERMRPVLRDTYPERTADMTDPDLDRAIEKANHSATGYGITAEPDVERYLYLMFELGFDFDREPPWSDLLARSQWSGQTRIDLMFALHEGRLWDGPDDAPFFP